MKTYTNPVYPYERPAEFGATGWRRPVVVVGAGPVGLATAIDLAQRDIPVVVLDDDHTVSVGSRAICYAKRALEILDRLGCGQPVVDKGIGWNVGKVFFRDELVYRFDLLPEPGHRRPAFVNLQQYWLEEYLVGRAREFDHVELRWKNEVIGVSPHADGVDVTVATPEGEYAIACDWLVVADGSRSPVRRMLGLEWQGQMFRDRFLIADIHMKTDFPTERWFWFDPPFHPNQSALLHRQADDVWRVDFQLGWDADPDAEKTPERIVPRLRAMLGEAAEFDIEWASVYTFACRRMQRFRHGRAIFAGDAAHVVSPFGARGANSGIQDVDNLAWKLALVMKGLAPDRLIDSYDAERTFAADENLLNSTRSTDFITPKSRMSRIFRDAVLSLAKEHPFARRLVNSGRLSVPAVLAASTLNTEDQDADFACGPGAMIPGAPAADAPVQGPAGKWLLGYLGGGFTLLAFDAAIDAANVASLARHRIPCSVVGIGGIAGEGAIALDEAAGLARRRYDALPGTVYLLRPDQHVCARWRAFDPVRVRTAIARATCNA
ncbi:MAG: FAD-dependent oxidoreductase [Betaproteobacteria bacterium]